MQKKKNNDSSKVLMDELDRLISKKEKENSALKLLLNIDKKTVSKKNQNKLFN
ncbi:MAG: hypothetical protein GXO88_14075 [Chlorobi bacterium]|nr:hypothetical protein [Chlorobiota bacterium]